MMGVLRLSLAVAVFLFHVDLGTSPYFHTGNYSIAMCAICHTPNQGGSTGWSASARVWVHGIHSASKRTVPFTWHAVSATDNYSTLQYPGVLKDCNQCHLPGTYDFSASQYTPFARTCASESRWRSAWNVARGRPNCWRSVT